MGEMSDIDRLFDLLEEGGATLRLRGEAVGRTRARHVVLQEFVDRQRAIGAEKAETHIFHLESAQTGWKDTNDSLFGIIESLKTKRDELIVENARLRALVRPRVVD